MLTPPHTQLFNSCYTASRPALYLMLHHLTPSPLPNATPPHTQLFDSCYTASHPALYLMLHWLISSAPPSLSFSHVITLMDIVVCYSSSGKPELWLAVSSVIVCQLVMSYLNVTVWSYFIEFSIHEIMEEHWKWNMKKKLKRKKNNCHHGDQMTFLY